MFHSRNIRLALAGLVLLLPFIDRADATGDFKFTECITNCIRPSSCPPSRKGNLDGRCMCKAAREDFLESILGCMDIFCKSDLRDFDDKFLDPMEDGCDELNQEIPKSKLKAAESIGSSFLSNLPTATTIATKTRSTAVVVSSSKTTLQTTAASLPTATEITSVSSLESSTSSAQALPLPTTSASPDSEFVDTSPFSNTRSTGSQNPVLMSLLALPLAVIGFTWR
ncbi:hypothetical protein QBC44DRAFT_90282 [Cladorrhinum sp. PSN332]|nr:hypothetical protein QBC44DRAFT_90282 [Cladorrhinum sp. PSN332]